MDKFILVDTDDGAQIINTSHIIKISNLHGDGSAITLSDGSRIVSDTDFKQLDGYLQCADLL